MHDLFELTQAKRWATWMVVIAVLLFVLSAVLHYFNLLTESVYQILIGCHWYSLQSILIFTALILGAVLFLLGVSMHVLCNNVSRLLKSYDEKIYKMMKK